jgi:hypothetical protein
MARKSFIQIDGKLWDKSQPIPEEVLAKQLGARRHMGVIPDLPDFVSPIDGKVYSGRRGMRDHCARHDVVPTADLAGLPVGRPSYEPDRAAIRESLKRQLYK